MSETLDLAPPRAAWPDNPDETRRRLEGVARDVRELASAEGASEEFLQILPELGPRVLGIRALPFDTRRPGARRPPLGPGHGGGGSGRRRRRRRRSAASWKRRGTAASRTCASRSRRRPSETRFPVQSHRAWLTPTDAVIVSCVPPSFEARVERELQMLPMLSAALASTRRRLERVRGPRRRLPRPDAPPAGFFRRPRRQRSARRRRAPVSAAARAAAASRVVVEPRGGLGRRGVGAAGHAGLQSSGGRTERVPRLAAPGSARTGVSRGIDRGRLHHRRPPSGRRWRPAVDDASRPPRS